MTSRIALSIGLVVLAAAASMGAESTRVQAARSAYDAGTLSALALEASDPVSYLPISTLENNVTGIRGGLFTGTEIRDLLLLSQNIPIPLGVLGETPVLLFNRVDLPLAVSNPLPAFLPGSNRDTGFGDILLTTLFTGTRGDFTLGVGPSFVFPSASTSLLGDGKFQVGPAMAVSYKRSRWLFALAAEQWWSIGGDGSRPDTSRLHARYIVRRALGEGWDLGMSPDVLVDWEETEGNRLTFPVGLGLGKTTRLFGRPFRVSLEGQYAVAQVADVAGAQWNVRLQIELLYAPLSVKPLF